jgi:putrescine transport system ATP-binding protein
MTSDAQSTDRVAAQIGRIARSPAAPSTPLLRLHSVSVTFGNVTAVDNLSLDIMRGEFFALLGPSGCGKSTLLRTIAGFERPDQGRIELDGIDISATPPYARPVNMMFQSYALFPHMNVERNIAFGLKQDKRSRADIRDRVDDVLRMVRLEGLNKRWPHQLSGGQKQRVALARAIVKQPKLLLLDEPLAALDKKLREETQFELMELQKKLDTAFVIVTHDQEEAMTVANRIAVMQHGRLSQVGTAAEIYERPVSRTVAGFIGDINLLEGRIARVQDGSAEVHVADIGAITVQAEAAVIGADAVVAVRPEKLRLSRKQPADLTLNRAQGRVLDIAYRGDMSIYKISCGETRVLKASMPNPLRSLAYPFQRGDDVWVYWSADAAILLER